MMLSRGVVAMCAELKQIGMADKKVEGTGLG